MSHHYGHISIVPTPTGYDVIFQNANTGQRITLNIPRSRIFEDDSSRQITRDETRRVAERVREILEDELV